MKVKLTEAVDGFAAGEIVDLRGGYADALIRQGKAIASVIDALADPVVEATPPEEPEEEPEKMVWTEDMLGSDLPEASEPTVETTFDLGDS